MGQGEVEAPLLWKNSVETRMASLWTKLQKVVGDGTLVPAHPKWDNPREPSVDFFAVNKIPCGNIVGIFPRKGRNPIAVGIGSLYYPTGKTAFQVRFVECVESGGFNEGGFFKSMYVMDNGPHSEASVLDAVRRGHEEAMAEC